MARPDNESDAESNLSTMERVIYVAAGLGLAAAAAKPRPNPVLNALALIGGSYLAWRGYKGSCPIKAVLIDPNDDRPRIARNG